MTTTEINKNIYNRNNNKTKKLGLDPIVISIVQVCLLQSHFKQAEAELGQAQD